MDLAIALTPLDLPQLMEALPLVTGCGAVAVEIGWGVFCSTDEELRALARSYAEAGLPIRSIHAPFGDAGDLGAIEEEAREKALLAHEDIIHRAHLTGARYLVIHPGRGVRDPDVIPGMERSARASLEHLVPLAEAEGVVLALENMLPLHPLEHVADLAAVVQGFDSSALKVCLDTGHAHVGEGLPGVYETLSDLVVTVHLADNDTSGDQHLQPPYGTVDWGHFLPALERNGFRDPLTIETRPWAGAAAGRMILEVQALGNTVGDGSALPRLATGERRECWLRCRRCGHFLVETAEGRSCACGEERVTAAKLPGV